MYEHGLFYQFGKQQQEEEEEKVLMRQFYFHPWHNALVTLTFCQEFIRCSDILGLLLQYRIKQMYVYIPTQILGGLFVFTSRVFALEFFFLMSASMTFFPPQKKKNSGQRAALCGQQDAAKFYGHQPWVKVVAFASWMHGVDLTHFIVHSPAATVVQMLLNVCFWN